jgi:Ssu72-like protein
MLSRFLFCVYACVGCALAEPSEQVKNHSEPADDNHSTTATDGTQHDVDEDEDEGEDEDEDDARYGKRLRFAMVCASNMNRSMQAHHVLKKHGLLVESYGTRYDCAAKHLRGPSVWVWVWVRVFTHTCECA